MSSYNFQALANSKSQYGESSKISKPKEEYRLITEENLNLEPLGEEVGLLISFKFRIIHIGEPFFCLLGRNTNCYCYGYGYGYGVGLGLVDPTCC